MNSLSSMLASSGITVTPELAQYIDSLNQQYGMIYGKPLTTTPNVGDPIDNYIVEWSGLGPEQFQDFTMRAGLNPTQANQILSSVNQQGVDQRRHQGGVANKIGQTFMALDEHGLGVENLAKAAFLVGGGMAGAAAAGGAGAGGGSSLLNGGFGLEAGAGGLPAAGTLGAAGGGLTGVTVPSGVGYLPSIGGEVGPPSSLAGSAPSMSPGGGFFSKLGDYLKGNLKSGNLGGGFGGSMKGGNQVTPPPQLFRSQTPGVLPTGQTQENPQLASVLAALLRGQHG